MAIHEHNEIEAKLDATGVNVDEFRRWASDKLPERYLKITSPDVYYRQGDNVVRHRQHPDGKHELTVKLRKSEKSTRDRLEIDLKFAQGISVIDVHTFLVNTGWQEEFNLTKTAHIFWFQEGGTHLTVVIYDVWRPYKEREFRRFIEVEAEKGSAVTVEHAKKRVNAWVKEIQAKFKLKGEALNDSLYEIYSGKRYKTL